MIQRANQMEVEIREKMKGGTGKVSVTHLLRPIQMKGHSRFFGKMSIEPGSSIGLHQHLDEEEIYYICKGTGICEDNGIRQTVKEGDIILTGNGASHSIENNSSETLEVLGVILLY